MERSAESLLAGGPGHSCVPPGLSPGDQQKQGLLRDTSQSSEMRTDWGQILKPSPHPLSMVWNPNPNKLNAGIWRETALTDSKLLACGEDYRKISKVMCLTHLSLWAEISMLRTSSPPSFSLSHAALLYRLRVFIHANDVSKLRGACICQMLGAQLVFKRNFSGKRNFQRQRSLAQAGLGMTVTHLQ